MNITSFKDYILLHDGDFYCDASDTTFDAVVTVDCTVDQAQGTIDIGAGDDYPNMDRFFDAFASKVHLVKVNGDVPIIDINGWLDHNREKVIDWVKENWSGSWYKKMWGTIKYQMIQEISNGIAGNKSNTEYGRYADLFEGMLPGTVTLETDLIRDPSGQTLFG